MLGEDFSDPKFHPVWAKAEELGAVLFIHPQSTPELAKRFKGNGWLSNTIGNPLDTTIALQHLIFEGTLDRFPGLKIIAAHGGGYLGSYAARGDHACFVSPQNCNANITLKKKPSEYLNQLYFDAMVFTPEGLRHLVAQVGASQVMLGTDHPIPWEQHPVDHVFATTTLTDKEKIAILGGNAAKLFGIKAGVSSALKQLPVRPEKRMRAVEGPDRDLMGDDGAEPFARKPGVQMKRRRLDLERGLAQFGRDRDRRRGSAPGRSWSARPRTSSASARWIWPVAISCTRG